MPAMHRVMLTAGLLALLTTTSASAAGNPAAEKAVLAAMDTWKQAMIKKDRALFDKVLHPALVYGHSDGHVEDKATAIKMVVDGPAVWEAIDFSDTKIDIRGTSAMVTGKVQYKERENGKLAVVNLVVLSVWVKGPQGWQMVGRQSTRPTPPAAAAAVPAAAKK